ncbi:MAG: helicase-related protein, partial [Pseudomonadota bacterium]
MAIEAVKTRNVTAVLGPTNTGKTHLAIERMLDHDTGMIGLPLRLLAREVYDRIANRIGEDKVALITGEEKIKPEGARYWVSTVEAMPLSVPVDFMAIDEVQLAADPERGHTFTHRLLHARGQIETLLLGAGTMRDVIAELIPGANFIARPRLSKLTYSGQKKITRLPERSAIIAFSSSDVYALAELLRRQRGGAAVVLGALSPRTRNAQVALYQSGDVDYLVATDAVGMGLNLDVDHVAFSATRKFDGQNFRNLTPSEIAQIAGRAGRHANDGTFGVTGDVEPFENDLVDRLESHTFDPVKMLQWRNSDLDFSSLMALRESLTSAPNTVGLMRARAADDLVTLETLVVDRDIAERATGAARLRLLWDVCQIPDYRKISSQTHAEMIGKIYRDLTDADGTIEEDWFARQVAFSDKTDGDIDTLATRIAHIRTWTFVSNRPDWLKDPDHWQARTREIENNLSDALHACLTQRFVDQRTSALMKGLRFKEDLAADIAEDGAITVESHYVGRLVGFRFVADNTAGDVHGKASRHAAARVLSKELGMRTRRVASAKADAFTLTASGVLQWRGEDIGRLIAGDDILKPRVELIADEHLQAPDAEKVQARLDRYINELIAERLKPLSELQKAEDVNGLARGIAFRLCENLGTLRREEVAQDIRALDQPARSQLRRYGVRFGAFNIFFPLLLKPAPTDLLRILWTIKRGPEAGLDLSNVPEPPRPGLTSVPVDPKLPAAYYAVSGFHLCGPRAVRIDMLERLADQIRAALAYRDPAPAPATETAREVTQTDAVATAPSEPVAVVSAAAGETAAEQAAPDASTEAVVKKTEAAPPA